MPAHRSVLVRRTFDAPRQRVFEAWCRPEVMSEWFFPVAGWRAEVSADVRVGGRYHIAMRDPAGGVHEQDGVYRVIEPVSRLVFTWTCAELGVDESLVTIELVDRDLGARTDLILRHELPDDAKVLREHEEGWTGCLGNLDVYVKSTAK